MIEISQRKKCSGREQKDKCKWPNAVRGGTKKGKKMNVSLGLSEGKPSRETDGSNESTPQNLEEARSQLNNKGRWGKETERTHKKIGSF